MQTRTLFSFPSVTVLDQNSSSHSPAGLLSLLLEEVAVAGTTDSFLRLEFVPDSSPKVATSKISIRLEAWREAYRLDPTTFVIDSSVGQLTVLFPPLSDLVPQNDPRIDVPAEFRSTMTWYGVVETFEMEIGRFITYKSEVHPQVSDDFYPNEKSSSRAGSAGYDKSGGSSSSAALPPYDPSTYVSTNEKNSAGGRLVLVNEENGTEVGEVGEYQVQAIGVSPGSKDPVMVQLPENGQGPVIIRPADSDDYLKDAMHPVYARSTIVSTAAMASRLIVTTSGYIASGLVSAADTFTKKTKPNEVPMTFNPTTHDRVVQLHSFSNTAAKLSAQTVGKVSHHAQNIGARVAGKNQERPERGIPTKPGLLNKSLIAWSTISDGIEYASKTLLTSSGQAATKVVSHKYGPEAGNVARGVTSSVTNVALVYVDASGVSRRAVIKGVAKGMVIGKVRGGGEVMVPPQTEPITGIPQAWTNQQQQQPGGFNPSLPGTSGSGSGSGSNTPGQHEIGFGNAFGGNPPAYGSIGNAQANASTNGYIPSSSTNPTAGMMTMSPHGTGATLGSGYSAPPPQSQWSERKGEGATGYRY